jgi:hypothetical protein
MSEIFKKLNLTNQEEILILQAPQSFEHEIEALQNVTIQRDLAAAAAVDFALVFVKDQESVDRFARALAERAAEDPIFWFAYPKMSSKKYDCEINRDTGWEILDSLGYQPVRQVAIDADWSALRFRRKDQVGK